MARLRGKPLNDYSRAEFEQLEQRVEDRALNRYLAEHYDGDDGDDGDDGRPEW